MKLDDWNEKQFGNKPINADLQPIVELLEGKAKLMVHCYRSFDMLTLIRISKEFNFTINTFHHALEGFEIFFIIFFIIYFFFIIFYFLLYFYYFLLFFLAYKIIDILKEEGIAVSIWTDNLWSSKLEGKIRIIFFFKNI